MLDEYAKHGRLVDAGTVEQAEQAAGRAWLADTLAGRDALLVVGSNAAAARLSNQLRAELVRLGRVAGAGRPARHGPDPLGVARHRRRGRRPGPGPPQRLAPRRLGRQHRGPDQPPDLPRHRPPPRRRADRRPRHRPRRRTAPSTLADPIALPASYVREQVTLAYAATVHAAHGRTVDAGYGVVGPGTDGPPAYVQATRGRDDERAVRRHPAHRRRRSTPARPRRAARRTAAEVLADVIRPPEVDPNRTALAEAETAAERGPRDRRPTSTRWSPWSPT